MKILWIEDFGGGLAESPMVIEMFSGLLSKKIFDKEYDPDEDVTVELPRLFEKHNIHQINICKSYMDWKKTYNEQKGDYDIVFIDINLVESLRTPDSEKPIENADFDRKAGFYIYHYLIKNGFPDDNIAFFTGEENSLKDFIEYCDKIFVEKPKNTFEKKPSDFEKLRKWLDEKANSPYLILRRGIIEGCRFLKDELKNIDESYLEDRLLFYKTTSKKIEYNPKTYKTEVLDYLTKLENFFVFRNHADNRDAFSIFVKELTSKWDISFGYFNREKEFPSFKTKLEEKFYTTSQFLMKMLRNCTAHDLLSHDLSEKEVAYFFMLAMRSFLKFNLTDSFRYEIILSGIFDSLSDNEISFQMTLYFERYLEESYYELKSYYEELIRNTKEKPEINKKDNYFLAMVKISRELADKICRIPLILRMASQLK